MRRGPCRRRRGPGTWSWGVVGANGPQVRVAPSRAGGWLGWLGYLESVSRQGEWDRERDRAGDMPPPPSGAGPEAGRTRTRQRAAAVARLVGWGSFGSHGPATPRNPSPSHRSTPRNPSPSHRSSVHALVRVTDPAPCAARTRTRQGACYACWCPGTTQTRQGALRVRGLGLSPGPTRSCVRVASWSGPVLSRHQGMLCLLVSNLELETGR